MFLQFIIATGLLATAVSAHVVGDYSQKFSCGAPAPSEAHKAASKLFGLIEAEARMTVRDTIDVPVYVHIVTSKASEFASDATVHSQIDVMNQEYASSGVSFTLKGIDKTVNSAWAKNSDEIGMKRALRKGDYATLNLYFVNSLGGFLGYSYLPEQNVQEGSDVFFKDGCSIIIDSMPGGSFAGYNLGKTAVHETGHWLGLYHTFQGGCNGEGDYVNDTPAQASASSGCPVNRNSCPSKSGNDPIHNYMDYSDDACYEEFTDGQKQRMRSYWSYRS